MGRKLQLSKSIKTANPSKQFYEIPTLSRDSRIPNPKNKKL
jgi:hypothetical protein